jgi:hypothetical protein
MAIEESNIKTSIRKGRKGKKIVVKEEKQVCKSVLHVSQDLTTRNG